MNTFANKQFCSSAKGIQTRLKTKSQCQKKASRPLSRSTLEDATAKSPIAKKSTANATKQELNAETSASVPAAKTSSILATATSLMISNYLIMKALPKFLLINRSNIALKCTRKATKNSIRTLFSKTKTKFSQENETAPAGLSSLTIIWTLTPIMPGKDI